MKKNENGFTLIEIIGAIIILGIIAIIAFATYTNSLKEFRTDYYTREVKTLAKAGEDFFNDNRNYRPTKILNAQKVLLNTLETRNYIDNFSDYNGDVCDESSYVLIVKENQNVYSYHTCLICGKDGYDNTNEDKYCDPTWLDPTKVVYGIGEAETAYVYRGLSREELMDELELPISYIRVNDEGKTIAERRGTKEGNETLFPMNIDTVDINTVGTYKVVYQYGNETKEREVVVYENEAPIVSYTKEETVATNLSGTTSTSTKTYHSGDWAQNVIVSISSKASSISTLEFQWNVDGRWQNFCDTDPCEKKIEREINQTVQFRVVDTRGHISLLTDPVLIKIDNTKPTCGLNITTAIGNNDWYNSDVNIAFSEKLDQAQSSDSTIVSGVKFYSILESTGTLNRVAKLATATHTDDTDGVTYKGYVEDEAGNFNTCQIAFKKDATLPECTTSGESTTWIKTNRTITYGCSDTRSECDPEYSGGTKIFTTSATKDILEEYIIKDKAGNQTTCQEKLVNVYIDKTNPSCTVTKSNTGKTTGVTTTVTCIDTYGECDPDNSDTGGTSLKKGTYTYTVKDKLGHKGTCSVTVTEQQQLRQKSCTAGKTCTKAGCGSETKSFTGANPGCSNECYHMGGASLLSNGQYSWSCTCYKTCTSTSVCGCKTWGSWSSWTNTTSCATQESSNHSTSTECRTVYN